MKVFTGDWLGLAARARALRSVAPGARTRFLELRPSDHRPAAEFGRDLDALIDAGFLARPSQTMRVHIPPDAKAFSVQMRALMRCPLFDAPSNAALRNYLQENFDREELTLLAQVQFGWVDVVDQAIERISAEETLLEFQNAKNVAAWVAKHDKAEFFHVRADTAAPDPGPRGLNAARALVDLAVRSPEPLMIDSLSDRLANVAPENLNAGLHVCIRTGLLMVDLDPVEFLPRVWGWPPAIAELNRPAPTLPPVLSDRQGSTQPLVPLAADLTEIIIALSEQPARVKVDSRQPFARDCARLAATLSPIVSSELGPPLPPAEALEWRVRDALSQAHTMAWVAYENEDEGKSQLVATTEGRAWLGMHQNERISALVEPLRWARVIKPPRDFRVGHLLDASPFWAGVQALLADTRRDRRNSFAEELRAAWVELGVGQVRDAEAWFDYAVRTRSRESGERLVRARSWSSNARVLRRERVGMWSLILRTSCSDWLVPLGGVLLATTNDGRVTLELTEIGAYLLDLRSDLPTIAEARSTKPLIVQPNFDVVFMATSLALEVSLARFCERRARGVGSLFAITRESCQRAAASGMSAADALAELGEHSNKPLPANVAHEIKGWFSAARTVYLAKADILRCPDAETASRLLSMLGAGATRLSDTVIELDRAPQETKLSQKLRKHGIFVERQNARSAKSARSLEDVARSIESELVAELMELELPRRRRGRPRR